MQIARRVWKSSIVFLLTVLCAGCFQPLINRDPEMPTRRQTRLAIDATEDRIRMFWDQHGRLPSSTLELPDRPDKIDRTKDGWGRDLGWAQIDEKTVRLSSLGKDGESGGTGEDEDWQLDVVVDEEQ